MAERYLLRKREGKFARKEELTASRASAIEKRKKETFHLDLWLTLALANWVLDFGRPIAAMYIPASWIPATLPGIGDMFHMIYNIIIPLCIFKLQERCRLKQTQTSTITHVCILILVMGASIHLVGDSIQCKLIRAGYQSHLSVRDNLLIKQLNSSSMVEIFELVHNYDEIIGHFMWYTPFFVVFFLYFKQCFTTEGSQDISCLFVVLVFLNGIYHWYLVTEAQVFIVFLPTLVTMTIMTIHKVRQGKTLDSNGLYLLCSFLLSLTLIALWVMYLWNDPVLRRKYSGWIYVPEPWTVFLKTK